MSQLNRRGVRHSIAALSGALCLIACVTAVAPVAASTVKSAQTDQKPCIRPQVAKASHWVQYCPLWRGNVPVYSSPRQSASIVGTLVHATTSTGAPANWFVGDQYFPNSNYTLGSYYNHWWAYTLADNNRWGWVSEVYFSGGGNDIGDAGLYVCTMGPHPNAC